MESKKELENIMKNGYSCEGTVLDSGDGEYIVKGRLKNGLEKVKILYYSANPPTYSSSYSGSGLPFPNSTMAFENTPNKGAVLTKVNGEFSFKVRYPNSYYVKLGTIYVPPVVYIKICGKKEIHTIKLGGGIPFRLLAYPVSRKGPEFYNTIGLNYLPPRSQEQILKDKGYPAENKMPKNFWGKAVPK